MENIGYEYDVKEIYSEIGKNYGSKGGKKKENVKKGTPLIYYDTNHNIRPRLVDKIKESQREVYEDYKNTNKPITNVFETDR